MGFIKPKAGKVLFRNLEITSEQTFRIARMGIGYVPQGRHLFPKMTALENLKTGMKDRSDLKELEYIFHLFPNLRDRLNQAACTLSGGEQQAVTISRALLKKPEILLLDEPTTGLMPLFVLSLMEIIKELNVSGMAILLIEEKVPFALSLANRVYFMVKGKIEYHMQKEELEGKKEILTRYLGVEVNL